MVSRASLLQATQRQLYKDVENMSAHQQRLSKAITLHKSMPAQVEHVGSMGAELSIISCLCNIEVATGLHNCRSHAFHSAQIVARHSQISFCSVCELWDFLLACWAEGKQHACPAEEGLASTHLARNDASLDCCDIDPGAPQDPVSDCSTPPCNRYHKVLSNCHSLQAGHSKAERQERM